MRRKLPAKDGLLAGGFGQLPILALIDSLGLANVKKMLHVPYQI